MFHMGIDYSSLNIALAGVTPDGEWIVANVDVPKQPKGLAGRGVAKAMRKALGRCFWDDVSCVWIERAYGPHHMVDTLAAVRGAILDAIPSDVTVDTITAKQWRAELGWAGMRKAEAKQAAREWCRQNLPMSDKEFAQMSEDQMEAAAIAWVCLVQSERAAKDLA
jgi:hypothetical protein